MVLLPHHIVVVVKIHISPRARERSGKINDVFSCPHIHYAYVYIGSRGILSLLSRAVIAGVKSVRGGQIILLL